VSLEAAYCVHLSHSKMFGLGTICTLETQRRRHPSPAHSKQLHLPRCPAPPTPLLPPWPMFPLPSPPSCRRAGGAESPGRLLRRQYSQYMPSSAPIEHQRAIQFGALPCTRTHTRTRTSTRAHTCARTGKSAHAHRDTVWCAARTHAPTYTKAHARAPRVRVRAPGRRVPGRRHARAHENSARMCPEASGQNWPNLAESWYI
jgi:hypothetical protein